MGFKQIVYLSETDKNTLFNTGTLTKDGKTVTYDEDNIYMTPTPETFGICSTSANTAAKTATITDFALVEGVTVSIQFTHTNTASNPTLNISSTGAVPIYKYGTSSVGITTATSWSDGAVVSLTYNGTGWIVNNYTMSAEGVGGGSVTSVRVQATSPIVSSTSTAQTAALDTTISLANANANTVLAGPSSGSSAAAPSYRSLVPADIPSHNHSAADITSGTLSADRGGTGTSTAPTQYGIIYASTTSAYASTGAGSSGQYLKSNGTSAPTWATFEAATVGLGSVSNNANLNSTTGAKGDIIYWSAANTPAHLTNTSSSTKNFLSITSQVPSWTTLAKGDVGLGNVENTKLSTWTGSTYIKTVGTITSGTWNGNAIASSYIGAHNHAASNITSGQLGVANGGTGAASFTANSAIISGSTTTSALTTRAIHNLSAIGNLGWTSNINTNIATVGSIAYWNGAYSGTSSNLSVLGTVTTGIWHGTSISLEYVNNWAFVGRNAEITANKNWYKVASCTINDVNEDRELVLHVYDTMVIGAARSGILNVRVRTSNPLTSTTPALSLVWEYNNGLTSDQFKLVSNANTSPCVAELWTNVPYNWIGRVFTVIRMGTRTLGQSDSWTLYKNYSVNDNGATGSTSSLTNSVTATYLPILVGNISGTLQVSSGQNYGIAYRNDTNLTIAGNLYFPDNGYTLRNQAPSGISPAFQVAGPTKAISLMVNSADTNRGLYDTTIDNWLIRLDTDSNVYINSGGTNSNINLNAQGTGAIAANKSFVASGDVYSGYSTDTTTRRAGTRSVGGRLFLYTEGTATATSGLWFYNNAGTGRDIITIPQTGNAKFCGGIMDQYDNSKTITARYYGNGQAATDWVCMWTNGSGSNGDMIGAVNIVDAVDKAIIYSSSTPTVVNGKLWLKPV